MKHCFVGIVFLFIATHLNAQDPLRVLAVRGNVTVGGKGLVVGQWLKTADKVLVPKSGYVGLAHRNGRAIEISKDGTYKVSDLALAASKKTGSVSSKFASYVVTELTEVEEPAAFSDKRRSNMKTTGAVNRAGGDDVDALDSALKIVGAPGELRGLAFAENKNLSDGKSVGIIMPRSTRLLSDTVRFLWHPVGSGKRYAVVVTDQADNVVMRKETSDTVLVVPLTGSGMRAGRWYSWHLEVPSQSSLQSSEYIIWILDGAERAEVAALVADIQQEHDPASEAVGHLVLAQAFEDYGCVYEAYESYLRALRAAPSVQGYKRLFAAFLLRQNCNLDAYTAYTQP